MNPLKHNSPTSVYLKTVHCDKSNFQLDLAISMKAALLAFHFMLLLLQVEPFLGFRIPLVSVRPPLCLPQLSATTVCYICPSVPLYIPLYRCPDYHYNTVHTTTPNTISIQLSLPISIPRLYTITQTMGPAMSQA